MQSVSKNHNFPSFVEFDKFPDSAQVRLPVVTALFGVSPATVWRMVKAKKLRSYKLTARTTTFNVGEIRKVLSPNEVA